MEDFTFCGEERLPSREDAEEFRSEEERSSNLLLRLEEESLLRLEEESFLEERSVRLLRWRRGRSLLLLSSSEFMLRDDVVSDERD